ncbi:hypothetical protein L5D93_12250 [Paenibacillus thiaminolyticus]|nr:hypothetical protein [Paenibacillus thiaminolyticus]
MNLNYEQVMVMGSGSLASNCILHLLQMNIPIPMTIYETNITNISTLESLAASNGIKYIDVPKEDIFLDLAAIRKSTLILVIGCYYIIPAEVIGNRCLSIINYHNSLLPKHPGRNAEAWAIFEQDKKTGITWHYVDERIDTGEIIIQREIPLDDSFSSLSLLRLQNMLALDTFKIIINDLLVGTISSYSQNKELRGRLHLSSEIPNSGFLDTTWNIQKIKAFLRAMDYGALRRMGQPKVIINHAKYTWNKTVFLNQGKNIDELIVNEDENYLLISKDGESIKLIGLNQEME